MIQIRMELNKRSAAIEDRHVKCKQFWALVNELHPWIEHTLAVLDEFTAATIYTPTRIDPTVSTALLYTHIALVHTGTLAFNRRAPRCASSTH